MTQPPTYDPLHVAMKYVAASCIDEGLKDEAEDLARFLELIDIAPRTVGLLHIWLISQKGQLRDALSCCERLVLQYPEAPEFQPVLAVLRFTCREPGWREVCARIIDSEHSTVGNKSLANSLLDGTFGAPQAAEQALAPAAEEPTITTPFDYSTAQFMRV